MSSWRWSSSTIANGIGDHPVAGLRVGGEDLDPRAAVAWRADPQVAVEDAEPLVQHPGVRSTNPPAWSWRIRACFAEAAPTGIQGAIGEVGAVERQLGR